MNLAFKEVFGASRPTLPLQDGGNIVCGNATRLDWEEFCPKDDGAEIYVLGNPPYLGARNQNKGQKADVRRVLAGVKGVNSLDYISCWFYKAENSSFQVEQDNKSVLLRRIQFPKDNRSVCFGHTF